MVVKHQPRSRKSEAPPPPGNGSGNGSGHLWADGVWRKDCPPSLEAVIRLAEPLPPPPQKAPVPATAVRRPVAEGFVPGPRHRLREVALALSVQAAALIYPRGQCSAADILKDAEFLARWIADTEEEKS